MASHVYHEIYIHLNWHVKFNRASLTADVEPIVHKLLKEKAERMRGVYLHKLGGTETHVHLAISIEPHISISDTVKELKGSSAHDLNDQKRMKDLEWQRGYGVVSFGKKDLPWVEAYIENQKQHHAKSEVYDRLERTSFEDDESDEE